MRSLLRSLVRAYLRLTLSPLNSKSALVQKGLNESLLREIARIADKKGFIFRAKFSSKKRVFRSSPSLGGATILIQGPISTSDALSNVEETIRIYTDIFPNSKIVLSTWENSLRLPDKFLRENNVTLVLTQDPGQSWPNNLTRQMLSTRNGLKAVEANEKTIVVKTRTDQRFNNPLALVYIQSMVQQFPGHGRIWSTDYGTGRYRVYGLSDQMQFGLHSDLLNYWRASSVEELHNKILLGRSGESSDIAKLSVAVHEILLATNYINTLGHHILWNWEDHLFCLRNYFGIIDSSFIGLELLSRERTPVDHVLLGMTDQEAEIENHLSSEEWFLTYLGNSLPTPDKSTLLNAMKVPQSDQVLVEQFWKERNNMKFNN